MRPGSSMPGFSGRGSGSLTPVLLRGVPMGERTLHPLELKTEGETLTFTVELCVPLPRPEQTGRRQPVKAQTLQRLIGFLRVLAHTQHPDLGGRG